MILTNFVYAYLCIEGAYNIYSVIKLQVKNIPDVSVAEEKEMMSAESSPNSSR